MTSASHLCRRLASIGLSILLLSFCNVLLLAQAVTIPVFPKYVVLGVVYAPPGAASNVTYGNSTVVGSTNSFTSTWNSNTGTSTSKTVGGGLFGFGASTTTTTANNFTAALSSTNTVTIQTTQGNSIATVGPISSSLGVNHDNDVIYILLNPVLTASATYTPTSSNTGTLSTPIWNGLLTNGCDFSASSDNPYLVQNVYGCDPNQFPYPDIVGIPVWCLKNPYYPGQGCAQWLPYTLRAWDNSYRGPASASQSTPYPEDPTNPPGLTLQDYADILLADPFVAPPGSYTNICHPSYGPNLDPNDSEAVLFSGGSNASVTNVLVTSGGTYTSVPTVAFSNGTGLGSYGTGPAYATAKANMNAAGTSVASVTITNGGLYSATGTAVAPTITFSGGGSSSTQATAVAYLTRSPATCGSATVSSTLTPTLNRFQSYGTVEYPEPGPNGLPTTYAGNFTYSNTNSNSTISADSHTFSTSKSKTVGFSASVGGSVQLGTGSLLGLSATLLSFDASFTSGSSNSMTWASQTVTGSENQASSSASYSITGPQLSDNYDGPATYNVYLDNVYGTFAFYSPLTPQATLGTIGVTSSGNLMALPPSPVIYPSQSAPQMVTLTNTSSLYPLTMVGPAITFTDPGFQLINSWNGISYPDQCSNQQLAPLGTCTAYVQFIPQFSDAPNTITLANATSVQATMIAAGTQNVSSFQNILITSQTPVAATVSAGSTQGATLLPSGVSQSSLPANNPIPYLFTFPAFSGSTTSQSFVFMNNYNVAVNVANIAYTNPTNYSTAVLSNNCMTKPINPGTYCSFVVQFSAALNAVSAIGTGITVYGTVAMPCTGTCPSSLPPPPVIPLAVAGASAPVPSTVTVSPTSLTFRGTICTGNSDASCNATFTQTVTVNNGTSSTATFNPAIILNGMTTGAGTFTTSSNCGSTLSAMTSCTITVTANPQGCAQSCSPSTFGSPNLITVDGTAGSTSFTNNIPASARYSYLYIPPCTGGQCGAAVFVSSPPSQLVSPGGTAQIPFQIAPSGVNYLGTVTFSATGLPPGATASFSPDTLAPNSGQQTVVLSIKTAATSANLSRPALPWGTSESLLGLLLLPPIMMRRRRSRSRSNLGLLTLIAIGLAITTGGLVGCSSSASIASVTPPAPKAQAYPITITATTGGVSQSVTTTLTVQ